MSGLLVAVLAALGVGAAAIPDYLSPVSYTLGFRLDLDNPGNEFQGSNTLKFKTAPNLPRDVTIITLNCSELYITSALIHYPSGKKFTIKDIKYNHDDECVSLTVDQQLVANDFYTLELNFKGKFNDKKGFFISSVNNENYLGMNSYPVYAKRIYPCFDKPNLRAKYDINLEINFSRRRNPTIITGLSGSYTVIKRDFKWFSPTIKYLSGTYKSTIDLPPYGFYFTVGNYRQADQWPVYIPDDESYIKIINQDLMDVSSSKIIQDLSKSTDFNLKLVVVPGLPVPGVSGYGIAAVSSDVGKEASDYSTYNYKDQAQQMLKAAVKSFFGTVVSPSSWDDVWLVESIPKYISHAALNQMTTTWKNWPNVEVLTLQQCALENSWSSSSSPVVPNNLNSPEAVQKFISDPAIVKGSAIIAMMETLAKSPLTTFVGFINKYKGKAVSSEDFLNYYAELNGLIGSLPDKKSFSSVVTSWLQLSGYPFLTVYRSEHEIKVNKKRFAVDDNNSAWMLPLSFSTIFLNNDHSSTVTLSDPNFLWLDDKVNGNYTIVKDSSHKLLSLFNIRGPGLYRVLYDDSSLQYLEDKLKNDVSFLDHEFLRTTLISDNFAFARIGLISYTTFFETLQYLFNERSLAPWYVAAHGFRDLWSLMYFSDLRLHFQNYVTDLMRPSYVYYGLDVGNGDMEQGMIRKEIISGMCDYGDEHCRNAVKSAYNSYIVGKKSVANSDIIDLLYCNGLRDVKDSQISDLLRQKYQPSMAQYQKESLFFYLACSGGDSSQSEAITNLLRDVLISSSYGNMPAEDMILAFKEIAKKPQHYEEALTYFFNNFNRIRSTLDDQHHAELIRYMGTLGSTDTHLSIFGSFTYNSTDKLVAVAIQDAVTTVQWRKKYLADHYKDIYNGLNNYQPPPGPSPSPSPSPPNSTTNKPPLSGSSISAVVVPALMASCMLLLRCLV